MPRTLIILAILAAALLSTAIPGVANAASCVDSFPADGHAGPWHTTTNGGTLHGNTVHVSCPDPTVHWSVDYSVQFLSNGVWGNVFKQHAQGNGTPNDFSFSLNPFACTNGFAAFPLRTHVDNLITGGGMSKPGGGGFVHICGF